MQLGAVAIAKWRVGVCVARADSAAACGERRAACEELRRFERIALRLLVMNAEPTKNEA